MDYFKVTFYVTKFSLKHFSIKYDDSLNDFVILDYSLGNKITIPMYVRKILNVRVNSRFQKKTGSINYATDIKNLSQIYDYVLVEDEIVTGIIVFDDILLEECAHITEISRGIYNCGRLVQRVE